MQTRPLKPKSNGRSWIIALGCTAFYWPSLPTGALAADSAAAAQTPELKAVYDKLAHLLHDYYPKAKLTTDADSIHFEFKLKSEIGYYSNRPVMAPQDGGILGELEEKPGQYQGKDKDRLPSELPDGFHTTLTMAPYSGQSKSHLLTTLMFPPDASGEFKAKFKEIVDAFSPGQSTASLSTSAPTTSTAPVTSAAVATASPTATTAAAPSAAAAVPAAASTSASSTASNTVTASATAAPAATSTSAASTASNTVTAGATAAPAHSGLTAATPSNTVAPKPDIKAPIAIVPPAAKKPVTASSSGSTNASGGLHLFDSNSKPIGGTNVGSSVMAATPKSAGMVKFPAYRYLPALPIKVQILASNRMPNGMVNISYYTPDPAKKAEGVWRQIIDKTPWNLVPDQVAGQLRIGIKFNVTNGTPNQLLNQGNNSFGVQQVDWSKWNFHQNGGGYDVVAAIVFTPAKTGTIVNIMYAERP